MTPPYAIKRAARAIERRPAAGAEADGGRKPHYGKVHAVPARDVVASSGWLAEALYRGFEIIVALVGLTAGLPVMLVAAVLIRCDSPGPALFFHKRPARSIKVRGRDLEGRTDLLPPPGGYEPETLYFVPIYFT